MVFIKYEVKKHQERVDAYAKELGIKIRDYFSAKGGSQ